LRAPPPAEAVGIDPRGLHLAFRALATSPEPSRNPRKGGSPVRTSPDLVPPLVALPACRPSVVSLQCVHSRTPLQAAMAFGPGFHPRLLFRPRGLSPPRRLAPHRSLRVCCAPLPTLGFAAFRTRGPAPPKRRWGPARSSPQRGHTLQRVPLVQQPYRITAAVAPLPVAACPNTPDL
jgi:hypothetical protein